jgi:hypothetical protein
MSLIPTAYFHFIFWGPDFHVLKPDFHHLRTPTLRLGYAGLVVNFPASLCSM